MRDVISACLLLLVFGWGVGAYGDEEHKQSGVEVSTEHKSEEGLEHGKAYAGSKEKKKDAELSGDSDGADDKEKKDKKAKKEKKSK